MPKKLTNVLDDLACRRAKPLIDAAGVARDRKLFDGGGLYLLVRVNDGEPARLWRLKYRLAGRERLLALGSYPDVPLATARKKAALARSLIADGVDPVQQQREQKAAKENAALETFQAVAERWLQKRASRWSDGHLEQNQQSLRDHVYPKIGRRAVAAIGAKDVVRLLEALEAKGTLEVLRRVRQRVGAVLAFAVQTGLRPDNPVRDLKGAFEAPKREHFASLKPADLPVFLRALAGYQGHPNTIAIVRMILWTACRTGEIRGARRSEFDLDAGLWTIPAERMKKRRSHVVPLPTQAVALLRGLQDVNHGSDLMFPSPGKADQMASENIVLQAIDKMGYRGHLTGHGLRATVATALEERGYATEIVKAQLSHAKANLTDAAYLRGVHIDRRVAMMQAWADELDVSQANSSVVTPIRRATAA